MERLDWEKRLEWAENIPINELFDEIRKITGLSDLKFDYSVRETRSGAVIEYESQDLSDKIGFLKLIFKEIRIQQFSSRVQQLKDEENEGYYYWGSTSIHWISNSNGSNGLTFLDCRYTDKAGWEFQLR